MKMPYNSFKMGIVNFSSLPVERQPQSTKPHFNADFGSGGMIGTKGKQSWFFCEAVWLHTWQSPCVVHSPLAFF